MTGFDVIIVGAGSAGCVLANRLSANPGTRICLVEAGPPDRNPLIHMPLGLALLARSRRINWAFQTDPQPQLGNRSLYWPRGRVLGGSSSINAMIYMRGHPEDYRAWAQAAGDAWDWPRVRDIFLAHEGNTALADDHHGTGGPLSVSDLRHANPLSRAFVAAGVECQHAETRDFNGARQDGVGLYQVTQKDGQRFSSARAFLDPVRQRPNLTILTGAAVQRVLFDGRRATGVRLANRDLGLRPGGEVILCGGAVNSPQLLMLSGLGPGAQLQAMGLPVLHDAPEVGANLADHLDITVQAALRGREAIGIAPTFLPRAVRAAWAYARAREGELTSNVAEAGGFARSGPDRDRPNLQFHFIPAYLHDHGRRASWGYGLTLHVCDLLPKSRGRISLASPDPRAAPRIDPNYLGHPEDLAVLLAGLRQARAITRAPALARLVARETLPGPDLQTDEALAADIRARAETIYHPVGTCRMGRDEGAVVDPAGRVRGVAGLRVADASIMPQIIAGNTNAPTMMIAENIARMILAGQT
jgi:choline dehydrogenase-like flavoprotein